MWEFMIILIILFIGSFLQGTSGFGFGLFSMGLLPFFLTLKSSTLLILALTFIISLNIVIKLRNHILIKDIFFILISALIGRVLSFFSLHYFGDLEIMKMILGFTLIVMVILLNIKKEDTTSHSFNKPNYGIIIGFIGGFIGGVFAVGGPFFVFYFLMRYQEKNNYNANLQLSFVVMNGFTTILHGINGDFSSTILLYILAGTIVVFMGVNLGLKWFRHLPTDKIKKLASFVVLIAAINLIFLR